MSLTWIEPADLPLNDDLIAACDGNALIAGILARRGLREPEKVRGFLSPDHYMPAPPEELPDLAKAVKLLSAAVETKQCILVWGDFDVDGQTATALLVDGLHRIGAQVVFYIPDRLKESHGIKLPSLEAQFELHRPDLVITCDTGVMEFAAVDWLRGRAQVIVTDHHALGDHLPDADAVINPQRLPPNHPLISLPGVGVAYKLMQALYVGLGRGAELPRLLDLVALGIVSDVALQTNDTRYLLQIGLDRLRSTSRIGLQALAELIKVSLLSLSVEEIGFQIGPRLNAAGRLGDARLAVELLTTSDRAQAVLIAQQLEGYNLQRRFLTQQAEGDALELIAATPGLLNSSALVLYKESWHPGVLGIVANRLAERYARPVVMLTDKANESASKIARGSARSVPGYDLGGAIAALADMLISFGGHTGAAGLSLPLDSVATLRERLSTQLMSAKAEIPAPTLAIDVIAPLEELSVSFASRVGRLSPFGEGNPQIMIMARDLKLSHAALIGRYQQHRKLTVEDANGRKQTIFWWGGATHALPQGTFDAAFNIQLDSKREAQLVLVDLREHGDAVEVEIAAPLDIRDFRKTQNESGKYSLTVQTGQDIPGSMVWAEAFARDVVPSHWKRRADLAPAETLIIYTTPPDPASLRFALDIVNPQVVYIIASEPPLKTLDEFLKRLRVGANNAIEAMDGKVAVDLLCGATAGSAKLVRAGLEYLVADGKIGEVSWLNDSTVRLRLNNDIKGATPLPHDLLLTRLNTAWREVEAYRRYFCTAPIDRLIER